MKNNYRKIKLLNLSGFIFLILALSPGLLAQDYSRSDNIRLEITMEPGNFLFVDDDNTIGPWNGTEENPYQNIPEAIDVAISGETVVVLPGSYLINQDLAVATDIGLFLFPGDTLLFGDNIGIEISGTLKAAGILNDSIYFSSSDSKSTWAGLQFVNGEQGSDLQFCVLENATSLDGLNGGAISISNTSLKISNCLFQDNNAEYGSGIYCEAMASPIIKNCLFQNNTASISGGALYGFQTDSLLLKHNAFTGK